MVSKSKAQIECEEVKNKIAILKMRLKALREIKLEIRALRRQLKPLEEKFKEEQEAYIKTIVNQDAEIDSSQKYRMQMMGIDSEKVKAARIKRIDAEEEEE